MFNILVPLKYRQKTVRLNLLIVIISSVIILCSFSSFVHRLFAQQIFEQGLEDSNATVRGQGQSNIPDNHLEKKVICTKIIRNDYNGRSLCYPSKLFNDFANNEIYILDSGQQRILVYTHDFYPLLSIGKLDGIRSPLGLAVDSKGYLFVAQGPDRKDTRTRISVFDPILRWEKDIYFTGFVGAEDFCPKNIAINSAGNLYIAGSGSLGVVVLNRDGSFSHILTPADCLGKGEERKASICDVEVDQEGNIYLLSEEMGRIYVYDSDENFLFKFGKKGGGAGKLSRPRGISVDDSNKRIYVVDYMRHSVNVYSLDGRFIFEFGGLGWGKGWFQYPSDVCVDASGNVLVADTFNNRVQVFRIK